MPHDAPQPLLLQPLWDAVVHFVGADTLSNPLFFVAVIMTTVVLAGLALSAVDVFIARKMRLREAATYLLITLPGYSAVFVLLQLLPVDIRVEVPTSAPTLFTFVLDLVLCLVVGDLLSYWWHRLEHASRFVWRNVHYVHHKVQCPLTVWSGFYVHPVESLCVFMTFYVFPLVAGVHPLVLFAYAAANTFITMVTHCGYDLPLFPKSILASAPMHELHHGGKKPTNFCVLLTLGDRLFGTFQPFSAARPSTRMKHGA